MAVALVYDPVLEGYRFPEGHPLVPARFTLAVELMRAWGLLDEDEAPASADEQRARVIRPTPATDQQLEAVHTDEMILAIKHASAYPDDADARFGVGLGDTPAFAGMHEAGALAAGASITAMGLVLSGEVQHAFSPAGGMHHAHSDRSAGFCIYNDPAVAIAWALANHPGLRVAYLDIDAHHGDGVQEAFYDRADVLTLSVHESGMFLYPGSGYVGDVGEGAGVGYALNVPLQPFSGPESYELVLEQVIGPALRAFAPDIVFLQAGGDTHRDDPLVTLDQTVAGYVDTIAGIARLADELCGGRLVVTGGGGYEAYSAVPRMWACAMAVLLGRAVPPEVPEAWLTHSRELAAGAGMPRGERGTFEEPTPERPGRDGAIAHEKTRAVVEKLRAEHPLLQGAASASAQ